MSEFDNSRQSSWCFHASEPEVIGPGIDLAFASCPHYIAGAILIVAEERTALVDAFFSDGSAGSKGLCGPCGFRETLPS
jgi:hypothetical protein